MTVRELYNILLNEIREGKISGMLPSISQMKIKYRTSHTTIHLAVDRLKMRGVVYGRQGKGVFVRQNAGPGGKTDTVLLYSCLPQLIMKPFYTKFWAGLKDDLQSSGKNLELSSQLDGDLRRYAAAIVLGANLMEKGELEMLRDALSGKICLLNHRQEGYVSVCNDNFRGGGLAAEKLYAAGHRRVGIISCFLELPRNFFHERFEGFMAFARKHPAMHCHEFPANEKDQNIRRAVAEILDHHPEITGIFAFKDLLAFDFQQSVQSSGRVFSIVGYDNQEFSRLTDPPLTTVEEDCTGLSRALSETIAGLIAGKNVCSRDIPPRLIERESVINIRKKHN